MDVAQPKLPVNSRFLMSLLSRSLAVLGGVSALFLAGCSGGGSSTADGSAGAAVRCPDGSAFCLISCDLGCGVTSCAVTEIAENQRLQFTFNQDLDARSVNNGSVAIRTASGEEPDGSLLVEGRKITFVPSISVLNGVSTFGFRRNQSYILTLVSGPLGLKSTSGATMPRNFSCTVRATQGIQDEDASPPRADLVSPSNLAAAPIDSTLVIRFSEVVDTTPFLQPISASTPIRYVLRRSRIPVGGTERECNVDSEAIQLEGLPVVGLETLNGRPVTTISLRPTLALPGLSCVEITVTSDVRDVSGRGAEESVFRFITAPAASSDTLLVENYANETRMDTDVSGGVWNDGARPSPLGGDGRHGSFNPTVGTDVGNGIYEWNCDGQTIPGSQTFDGNPDTVVNGEFYFTDFVVPAGTTVRFVGSKAAKVFVRGKVEILGSVEANGRAQVSFNCRNPILTSPTNPVPGQQGSLGGAGGGRGGQGGDRCFGTGAQPANNGRNGQDVQLALGHAYAAQAVGTGGRGSPIHPAHGLDASLTGTYTSGGVFNSNVGYGGSGGGFNAPGSVATNNPTGVNQILPAAPIAGGIAFDPLPKPGGVTSLDHFLIGGSGGGGGGSHSFLALQPAVTQFQSDRWKAGGGGTGGGGAIAIRAGRSILVANGGRVESKGGRGATYNGDNPATANQDLVSASTGPHWGIPVPGGGGSGGSLLLQASRDCVVDGTLDTSGGVGSLTDGILPNSGATSLDIDNRGGDGAPGFYRLEAGGLVGVSGPGQVPAYDPARNSGLLQDRDSASGCRSLWRSTGFVFPPEWLRYELEVDTDGDGVVDQIYSDDPAVPNSIGPANDPLGPVTIKFQGARVNSQGVPDPDSIRQWRDYVADILGVGINSDLPTGFRYQMLFNLDAFPNCVVKRLTVATRG